jgi:quercetin dioxygenase-like cupin family protein
MSVAEKKTPELADLVAVAKSRKALGTDVPADEFVKDGLGEHPAVYDNKNERLNIDFSVVRLDFPGQQTMDPRIVRIAPGANNERHRHAHESIFVVLQGRGEVLIGETWRPLAQGEVAFIPRWIFHQTRNVSQREELVLLAVTDFGFTSSVLGDYDKRTRLADRGADAPQHAQDPAEEPTDPKVKETPFTYGWWRYIVGGGPKR